MKKSFILVMVLALEAFAVTSPLFAAKPKSLEPIEFDLIQSECGDYTIKTDPKAEAMMILCNLAEHKGVTPNYFATYEYMSAVNSFFVKQKDHSAVKLIKNLTAKFSFGIKDYLILVSFMNEDLTGFRINEVTGDNSFPAEWKKAKPQKVLEELNQFIRDSKFDKFYLLHRADYLSMHTGVVEALEAGAGKFISDLHFAGGQKKIVLNMSQTIGNTFYCFDSETVNGHTWDYLIYCSPYFSKATAAYLARIISCSIMYFMIPERDSELLNDYYAGKKELRKMYGNPEQSENDMNVDLTLQLAIMHQFYYFNLYLEGDERDVFEDEMNRIFGQEATEMMKALYDSYFEKEPSERSYIKDLSSVEMEINTKILKKQIEAFKK